MTRQVALLRGINVGSSKRIAMADVRASMAALGYDDVATLLQSGNVVFSSHDPPERAATRIASQLQADAGIDIGVIVRTSRQLAAVVRRNPLRAHATNPKFHHVVFLSEQPDKATVATVDPEEFLPERFAIHGREVYVWQPGGAHKARLTHSFWEKRLKVTATARNWNTVEKLREMSRPD